MERGKLWGYSEIRLVMNKALDWGWLDCGDFEWIFSLCIQSTILFQENFYPVELIVSRGRVWGIK